MGMCAVLGMWVCWDCIWGLVKDGKSTIGGRAAFPVFRACGGILMLQWFWGCSVFIWTRYRINYIYLFDFDPRIVATPLGIFQNAVDNTLVFMVLTLLYYKVRQQSLSRLALLGQVPPGDSHVLCFPCVTVETKISVRSPRYTSVDTRRWLPLPTGCVHCHEIDFPTSDTNAHVGCHCQSCYGTASFAQLFPWLRG